MSRARLNNRGAALVMVIIAMMFVGIIAAIALTLTVGNSKSTKATIDTSENFYSSESILNDLEMYLKKLATDSATKAYADTLVEMTAGDDVDDKFAEKFAADIKSSLLSKFTGNVDANNKLNLGMLQEICYDRYGLKDPASDYGDHPENIPISIQIDPNNIVESSIDGKIVIKNVVITLKENGYESTITTDITFDARFPRTGTLDSSKDFGYNIDHYLLISGGSIKPNGYADSPIFTRGAMKGDYTGNIYAYRDFIVQTGDEVSIKTYNMIVGGDVIVDKAAGATANGEVTIGPIDNVATIWSSGTTYGTKLWAENMKLYDGNVTLQGISTKSELVDTYLAGNLELNGKTSEFKASECGEFVGYSYDGASVGTTIVSTTAPKSSAIILNGLGAKLDLSGVNNLKITGTAYTAISSLGNIDTYYASYKQSSALGNITFYTQGESITYRALQALYLVPGYCLTGIGHNPMDASELGATLAVKIPGDIEPYLVADVNNRVTIHYERYVGSADDKVYILWNFASKEKAVEYFNTIINKSSDEFSGKDLADKQLNLLKDNSGEIKLPSSGMSLYGNAVYLNGGHLKVVKGDKSTLGSLNNKFNSLLSNVDGNKTGNGNSIIGNMFSNNELGNYASGEQKVYDLVGPLDENINSEGKALTYTICEGPKSDSTVKYSSDDANYMSQTDRQNYKLVVGDNINWTGSFDSATTYIFVTPGNVTISDTSNGSFRGMIIAGGDINLPNNGEGMKCLGMLSYIPKIAGAAQEQVDTTEFQALLGVRVLDEHDYSEKTDNGNYKLRQIFGVADTSTNGGSGNGDDFVSILTSEWKRN